MEVLSEHLCQGWLEGYLLTGRHGLFATYEAFAMVSASMTIQHTKWLEEAIKLPWRAPIPSLNILLTSTCWRNDHNGFSHQGPGLIDTVLAMKGTVARIYLPPDANCLLSVADHCFRSRNYVNLIVIDKQPQLQWLDMDAAVKHCTAGASVWHWASNDQGGEPDVVLAAAGDTPTLEVVAAAWLLRKHAPDLKVRVVNVADLMCLYPRSSTRTAWRKPGLLISSPPPGQSSSLSTAINGRSTRSCTGGPARNASMCAVSWRRGRRPRPSTWSSVTR